MGTGVVMHFIVTGAGFTVEEALGQVLKAKEDLA